MINQKIQYIIPLAGEDEKSTSFFQGFQYGILEAVDFVKEILKFPHHIVEFSFTREENIKSRISGSFNYSILPINKSLLSEFVDTLTQSPFICILSSEETIKEVESFLLSSKHPILHISTKPRGNAIHLDAVDQEVIFSYVYEVVEYLKDIVSAKDYALLKGIINNRQLIKKETISLKNRNHLVTVPNELVLRSQNYELDGEAQLNDFSNGPYINAIVESATIISKIRNQISGPHLFPPAVNLILTAPSLYRHHYRTKIDAKKFSNGINGKVFIKAMKLLYKQTDYSFKIIDEELQEQVLSGLAGAILAYRTAELRAYTVAVAVKACNNFSPVLRLSPVVNTLHSDLEDLARCSRGKSPSLFKLNKIMRRIIERLSEMVDPSFMQLIDRRFNQIKLISDTPLEWLPVRGLPLMLRYDVSRIPTTPGNLFFQQTTYGDQIILTEEDFNEILVIRSFIDDDPIKFILQECIETVVPAGKRDFIKWVDVNTEEEFIHTLNKFTGAVLVYDGHGCNETDTDIGGIRIGKERINLWDLRGKVRMPPIVMLSVCDTHPIDSSHASIANGFFASGAVTVLASLLPINSIEASIFMARLMYRINDFLPILLNSNNSVRWIHIIAGMLRMSYVSELIMFLGKEDKRILGPVLFKKIQMKANVLINSLDADWYEKLLKFISKEIGWEGKRLESFINEWGSHSECIKYIQLGNPEMILILSKNIQKKHIDSIN